jgi:hypothetical protein
MSGATKHDKALDALLRRERLWPSDSAAGCPDAGLLAGYADRSLSAAELEACERHVSLCAHCQKQLAMIVLAAPAAQAAGGLHSFLRALSSWRILAPAGALAAALLIWVTIRPGQEISLMTANRQAEALQAPEVARPAPAASEPSAARSDEFKKLEKEGMSDASARAAALRGAASPGEGADVAQATRAGRLDSRPAERTAQVVGDKKQGKDESAAAAAMRAPASQAAGQPRADAVAPAPPPVVAEQDRAYRQQAPQVQAAPAPPATQEYAVKAAPQNLPERANVEAQRAPANEVVLGARVAEKESAEAKPRDARREPARAQPGVVARFTTEELNALSLVASPDPAVFWRVGKNGTVLRTRDAGKTWVRQTVPVTVELLAGSAPAPAICWLVGRHGTILRTSDGEKWARVESPTPEDLLEVKASDSDSARIASATGRSFETSDGGRTWRKR